MSNLFKIEGLDCCYDFVNKWIGSDNFLRLNPTASDVNNIITYYLISSWNLAYFKILFASLANSLGRWFSLFEKYYILNYNLVWVNIKRYKVSHKFIEPIIVILQWFVKILLISNINH